MLPGKSVLKLAENFEQCVSGCVETWKKHQKLARSVIVSMYKKGNCKK